MANPLDQLSALRKFRKGMDVESYLEGENRQNLKAIESAFRTLSPANNKWQDAGSLTINGLTENPILGTVSYNSMKYRIEGSDALVMLELGQTAGGSNGSGDYTISIPNSIGSIDTNISRAYTGSDRYIGIASGNLGSIVLSDGASKVLDGHAVVYSSTKIRIIGLWNNASYEAWSSAKIPLGGIVYLSGIIRIPLSAG